MAGGYSGIKGIQELKVDIGNLVRVSSLKGESWYDKDRCNGTDQATHAYLDLSSEAGKAMYSSLLSAKLADKPVALWLAGCKELWGKNLPVNQINLYKVMPFYL